MRLGLSSNLSWCFPAVVACLGLTAGSVATMALFPAVAGADPTVTVTPAPGNGSYATGQVVSVSVGANSLFAPHARIVIIECADPGGTPANLPTNFSDCDGNTINADTVLVQDNGSFAEQAYTLYALPNAILGERTTWRPVCDPTNKCVLYVGENQDDFSQPKVFSPAFAFTTTALIPTATTGPSPSPSTSSTASATTSPSAAVSLDPATLAFTGGPDRAPLLVALGAGLVGAGMLGRRTIKRRGR